jgi:serine/threonine protein kinase
MNRHADGPFENEVKVLRNLAAYPHPHIVASLASWASDDMRYILYPLAKGNLRSLFSQPPPAFDAAGIMWLLRQLEGLAGAVGHVHNMGNLGTGRKIRSKIGFHHDIKPENILLFEDVENLEMPKLMLTDFGSGRVNEDSPDNLSHKTDNYRGTLTYAGPDMHMYGHVSRPFDMWALGCVFLEVLIWMCVPGADQAVEEHARMRLDDPELPTGRGAMDDTYWYKSFQSSGPTYRLKPSVLYAFSSLEDHCHGMEVFQSVLRLVKRLLVIDPPARLKARDLEYELHLLKEKAKMELERDAELDLRLANKSRGIGIGDASGKAPRLVLSLRPSRIPLPPSPVGSFPSTISLSEDSEDSMPELLIRPPSPRAVLLERRHRFSTDSLLEINAEREG